MYFYPDLMAISLSYFDFDLSAVTYITLKQLIIR